MDKLEILHQIIAELSSTRHRTLAASDEAHSTATHKDNVAENKYDTLGLEAAYLAHGQSKRALELKSDIAAFDALLSKATLPDEVTIGSLIKLESDHGNERLLYLGPSAGGLTVDYKNQTVTVITPGSPLGQSVQGASIGDEIIVEAAGDALTFFISKLW